MSGRITIRRPNSTPRAARSRWCPLPGRRSSLVCVLDPERAANACRHERCRALGRDRAPRTFAASAGAASSRAAACFRSRLKPRKRFARRRIALVGEAAHVVPPIGAQGLNLGLRDAATLAEVIADAQRQNLDLGARAVLTRYEAQRRADVTSRSARHRSPQSQPADRFFPHPGHARPVAVPGRPHRSVAPRADARRRRAGRLATSAYARGGPLTDRHFLGTTAVKSGLAPPGRSSYRCFG